jgi:hypothetical protein
VNQTIEINRKNIRLKFGSDSEYNIFMSLDKTDEIEGYAHLFMYKSSYLKTIMIFWILGLVLLAGIAYYVMSTQGPLTPPAAAPCNTCPHANGNAIKTNVDPWQ